MSTRSPSGQTMDIGALQRSLREFTAERDWQPFHTPKNLAMALMVEAAELAEIFQWLTPEQSTAARGDTLLQQRAGEEVADVLLRTNVDKLTLLPSGTPHPKATEMLASDAMTRLLDDMATRYPDRIILFDSPPLLLTTESRVLATHMGQIVMVVHAGRTLQASVQEALSTIEACPVKLMVLNKARGEGAGGYGYGGYGYGYGYGYSGYSYGQDDAADQKADK